MRKETPPANSTQETGPAVGHLEWEQPQRHLLERDAPKIVLSFLDTAQVFQTEAFQQLHQALIIH